ncbi:MAG TPA: TlpA disulfide reductase family protein [Thermoanaerobaculia bacterium]|nr:TlpA disulfide reductase family protein [Thermoanaerobaculia bacterium]
MTYQRAAFLASLTLLLPALARAASPEEIEKGRAALDAARLAYQKSGAFRETLELTIVRPSGKTRTHTYDYGVGPKDEAFLVLLNEGKEMTRFVAREGKMAGTASYVEDRYAEVPYRGDLAAALGAIGADQTGLTAPAAVVASQGGDLQAFLHALRQGILGPLEIVGFHEDGSLVEVELKAEEGTLTVGLDPATHRLRQDRLILGEGTQQVKATGRYTFTSGDPGAALAFPDLTGRTAMATLQELERGGGYPLGQPAPPATLRTMDGGTVRLADLRGSVVVLDFWATWCVACWGSLKHTAELAAWASGSGLPVRVFALNTLEKTSDPEEQRRLAAELLRAKGLDLPVLLDSGRETYLAFHDPGLPSLVIIGKDGRLARYHSGFLEDMAATVKGEVAELLE